jgi:hypothetical protein
MDVLFSLIVHYFLTLVQQLPNVPRVQNNAPFGEPIDTRYTCHSAGLSTMKSRPLRSGF